MTRRAAFYVTIRPTGGVKGQGAFSGPYWHHGDAAVAAESVRRYFGPLGPGDGVFGSFAAFGVARMPLGPFPVVRNGRAVQS